MIAGNTSEIPRRFASLQEAESEAAVWLRRLQSRSPLGWKRDSPDTLTCDLADGVPAQVVVGSHRSDSEWFPSLWFTVGIKYEGSYWQGRVGEWERPEVLSEEALAAFDTVIEVLNLASQTSRSDPDQRFGLKVIFRCPFDSATLPPVIESLRETLAEVGVEDRRLMVCIRELADNAIHHSGQGGGWFQVEHEGKQAAVTVQDGGIGIHRSMTAMYPDLDNRSALLAAFGMDVSGAFDDPDRGLGLGLVLQYTRSGANLLLESEGQAYVGSGGKGQVVGKSTQKVPGVSATLFVRTSRR